MSEATQELPISEDLLQILRDPAAVQEPEKYGPDPGRLELVHNAWLVSSDTGYKYPIKDGIPIMLVEEGERWKDTAIEDLPLPPESADPLPAESEVVEATGASASHIQGLVDDGLVWRSPEETILVIFAHQPADTM